MTAQVAVKVHAVVVTFNPDRAVLQRELALLAPQVEKIWVIDNASSQFMGAWLGGLACAEKLELVSMSANLGLGAAQNVGIKNASAAGARHVLILDQDSEPMHGMVQHLLICCDQLQARGVAVAAVAPVYADSAAGPASGFVRLGWVDYKKQTQLPGQDVVEADFFISSGSLIPVSVLNDVGAMDESLFIDHVDTEWCLRARFKGYRLFGVPSARMVHALGNRRSRIWFLRWRNVHYHSPFRYFYIIRNGLLLQRRAYIPLKWKIAELYRIIRMFLYYGLFGADSYARLKEMLKGLADGLRGVSGCQPRGGE